MLKLFRANHSSLAEDRVKKCLNDLSAETWHYFLTVNCPTSRQNAITFSLVCQPSAFDLSQRSTAWVTHDLEMASVASGRLDLNMKYSIIISHSKLYSLSLSLSLAGVRLLAGVSTDLTIHWAAVLGPPG